MDWPTTVLGLGVCVMIAYLAGHLPRLLQDLGDTVPVADLREEGQAQYREHQRLMAQTGKRLDHAYALGYDKGYHDACIGLPKDPHNGSGVIIVSPEGMRQMRESGSFKGWTGETRG